MNDDLRAGVAAGVAAYALWGSFPLYFRLLEPTGPLEILAHRILWSLLVLTVVLFLRRRTGWVRTAVGNPRMLRDVGAASMLIATNWLVYVWAVSVDRVVDAALGYFINPLVTVAFGVVVLGERLRRAQWIAVCLGAAAVAVIIVGYGQVPWLSFVLAGSFAGYGFLKRRIELPAMESLAVETVFLAPAALLALFAVGMFGGSGLGGDGGVLDGMLGEGLRFGSAGPGPSLLLATAGIVTATPLVLFAAAARRIPLSLLGLLQYLTPAAQFVIGVAVFGEDMPPERLAGFALIWVALALLSFDAIRMVRALPAPAATERDASGAP